jgi:hypothetical protein
MAGSFPAGREKGTQISARHCTKRRDVDLGPKPGEVLPRLVRPPGPFYDLETAVVSSR